MKLLSSERDVPSACNDICVLRLSCACLSFVAYGCFLGGTKTGEKLQSADFCRRSTVVSIISRGTQSSIKA